MANHFGRPAILGRRASQNLAERCLPDSPRVRPVRGFAGAKKRLDSGPWSKPRRRQRQANPPARPGRGLGAVPRVDARAAVDKSARVGTRSSALEGGSWSAGCRPSNHLAVAKGPRDPGFRGCLFMAEVLIYSMSSARAFAAFACGRMNLVTARGDKSESRLR
jgi:hypothetical protein